MKEKLVVVTYEDKPGSCRTICGTLKANSPSGVIIASPTIPNGGGIETLLAEEIEIPRHRIFDIVTNPTKE